MNYRESILNGAVIDMNDEICIFGRMVVVYCS